MQYLFTFGLVCLLKIGVFSFGTKVVEISLPWLALACLEGLVGNLGLATCLDTFNRTVLVVGVSDELRHHHLGNRPFVKRWAAPTDTLQNFTLFASPTVKRTRMGPKFATAIVQLGPAEASLFFVVSLRCHGLFGLLDFLWRPLVNAKDFDPMQKTRERAHERWHSSVCPMAKEL